MSGLHVVCLISGGKDSLFSILHCQANGHDVVALANLHPSGTSQDVVDDLDSYMYQTIGHAIIPLYAEALDLPLYRQSISGIAVNRHKCYGPLNDSTNEEDETEDLMPLLQTVKKNHPIVNAVSTGAILSDYQRTRVESVAVRLGLTPLSYLWQWPRLPPYTPSSLLDDMVCVGQDSRIVKVASGGLDDSMLWQNVADRRTIARLLKTAQAFGSVGDGAVLGEGGEYETLAIAGPAPLWKGRIVVEESDRAVMNGEAGSASVRIKRAMVKRCDTTQPPSKQVRKPPLLDDTFESILNGLDDHNEKDDPALQVGQEDSALGNMAASEATMDNHVIVSELTGEGTDITDQTQSIMEQLKYDLARAGHGMHNVAYTSIILREMSAFPAVNAIYGSYFVLPNPPARVTIACANVLPPGKHVMVSATSVRCPVESDRKGLHVQSRSYWAPANIGPYSQAISVPLRANTEDDGHLVYVAGQIPLVPSSMALPDADTWVNDGEHLRSSLDAFGLQAVLSMQHVHRIGKETGVKHWNAGIAFVTAASTEDVRWKSRTAQQVWSKYFRSRERHTEDGSDSETDDPAFDVWNVTHGNARGRVFPQQTHSSTRRKTSSLVPPLTVIQVDTLPRESSIEWVTYGYTSENASSIVVPHFRHLLDLFRSNCVG